MPSGACLEIWMKYTISNCPFHYQLFMPPKQKIRNILIDRCSSGKLLPMTRRWKSNFIFISSHFIAWGKPLFSRMSWATRPPCFFKHRQTSPLLLLFSNFSAWIIYSHNYGSIIRQNNYDVKFSAHTGITEILISQAPSLHSSDQQNKRERFAIF